MAFLLDVGFLRDQCAVAFARLSAHNPLAPQYASEDLSVTMTHLRHLMVPIVGVY